MAAAIFLLPRQKLTAALVFLAMVFVLLGLQTIHWPVQTRLWRELQNFGHVPLFGTFALVSFWFSTEVLGERIKNGYPHYLIALVITFVIGSGTELVQITVGREADLGDLIKNMIGGGCFLAIYSIWDPRLTYVWKSYGTVAKRATLVATIILLALSAAPLTLWSIAYVQRDYAFPQLVSFGSRWSQWFLETDDAELHISKPPRAWPVPHGDFVGRLTLTTAAYPGLWVNDPYPDWTGYEVLAFDIYSEMTEAVTLTLRVHDREHDYRYGDRFNRRLELNPGLNRFEIPLEAIRRGPKNRLLDMTNIAAVALFAAYPDASYTLYVSNLRLKTADG